MLNRYKWNIYHCRRIEPWEASYVEGMQLFAPPTSRRINLTPVSSELMLESGGDLKTQYLRGRIAKSYPDKYAEGDRCYVHTHPPMEHNSENPGCDYVVESVKEAHRTVEIMLKKLVEG